VFLVHPAPSTAPQHLRPTADRLPPALSALAPASAIPVPDGWLPLPSSTNRLQQSLKGRGLMHYNRLIALVLGLNGVVLAHGLSAGGWWNGGGPSLATMAFYAQANLLVAIALRQQFVINVIGWVATRPSTRWPLRLRWMLGKYYHLGGVHVGGALAGTLWYLAFVGAISIGAVSGTDDLSAASVVTSYLVVILFVVMVVMAMPRCRRLSHDRFEVTHRFCGWTALVLVWINTVLFVETSTPDQPVVPTLLATPSVWMLSATTLCAAWPWLRLRRVAISVARPSLHAVVVSLDHGRRPAVGTTRAISRRPFVGWHHFANIPAAVGEPGYRMVISRAGDWTGAFIDHPPTHVWVRGRPAFDVANARLLFDKVVYVVTGSGIGPALGHLLSAEPARLVWVTRNPTLTYGAGLVAEVMAAQPDAVIWDTGERGKPDVLALAHRTYVESGADAVICISNSTVTWQVVTGLERCGIPAFGPIWDS
jgi:hypothetical protein